MRSATETGDLCRPDEPLGSFADYIPKAEFLWHDKEYSSPPGWDASPCKGWPWYLLLPIDTAGWREVLQWQIAQEHNTVTKHSNPESLICGHHTFKWVNCNRMMYNCVFSWVAITIIIIVYLVYITGLLLWEVNIIDI